MTDKQIIIDGVDISGCENYIGINTKTHNCTLYDGYLRPCKGADCYYKQLLRKEQECEELKDLNTRLDNQRETYWKEYQKLKQTLTEIKELIRKAVTPEETKTYSESLDCLYKALEKCEVIDE